MSDDLADWPAPAPDPPEELGETANGLLPTLERIRALDNKDLAELRVLVSDWQGPLVEMFRHVVAERVG
jgi:hypothetical protein